MHFRKVWVEQAKWAKRISVPMKLVKHHPPHTILEPPQASRTGRESADASTKFNFQTPLPAQQRNRFVLKFIPEHNKKS